MNSARRVPVLAGVVLLLTAAVAGASAMQPHARPGATYLATAADGAAPDGWTGTSGISADGSTFVFSNDGLLLNDGIPGRTGVFARSMPAGTLERVSTRSDGTPLGGWNVTPAVSADGRYVAFLTTDPTLPQVGFLAVVKDRLTGALEIASRDHRGQPTGAGSPLSVSGDGQRVAFCSGQEGVVDQPAWRGYNGYVHDRTSGRTMLVPVAHDGGAANGESCFQTLAADGRHVAFWSFASNLVPADRNSEVDVFLRDLDAGTTELVSVAQDGTQGNATSYVEGVSADGRHVAFVSFASNLVPNDTNPLHDIFLRDTVARTTERVNLASDGTEADFASFSPQVSADGRYVTFTSQASNLVQGGRSQPDALRRGDMFIHDRLLGETQWLSVASDGTPHNGSVAGTGAVSEDGRWVAFNAEASNVVAGVAGTHVYLRDRGPELGVAGVSAVRDGADVVVRGRVTFTGAVLAAADDPADDGQAPGGMARQLGGELVGADVTYRAERADVMVRWRLAHLPGVAMPPPPAMVTGTLVSAGLVPSVAGMPGVAYELDFLAGGTRYIVRGERVGSSADAAGAHAFALLRCDVSGACTHVTRLTGSVGGAGTEARVAVPLDALGVAEGAGLDAIVARSVLGLGAARTVMDHVDLLPATVPARRVTVGVARAGEPPAEEHPTTVVAGELSAKVPAAPEDVDAVVRICLGERCEVQRFRIEG